MHRSLLIAGTFALATFAALATGNREASAARLIYGTCFPQFRSCMAGCSGFASRRALDFCVSSCLGAPRCDIPYDMRRREAFNNKLPNGKLPESTLPGSQMPDSELPGDNLPDGHLP